MQPIKVLKASAVLSILVLITVILVFGKPFLVPLSFGGMFAMLLLPVAKWMQKKGVNQSFAIVLSILLLLAVIVIVGFFVSWQLSDIADNASRLREEIGRKYEEVRKFVAAEFGVPVEQQEQIIKEQQSGASGKTGAMITGFLSGLGSFLTNTLLVFVYIFLFMYFRGRIKGFIMRLVPEADKKNALATLNKSQQVIQKYLGGLFLMILLLWVMYSIGFSLAGVKNAIFFAILCGLLEIVPFVGNLTGTILTVLMSLVQGGDMNLIIAILVTYGLVQFIQSYLLEPLVVGAEVNINPMATILGLVAGELLWGIPGMILAIPLMGIAKIVCDHVPVLQPYAYLIGQEEKKDSAWKKKLKEWAKKFKSKA